MTRTSKLLPCSTLLLALAAPFAVQAQAVDSPWLVRVRAVNLDSANKDSTGLGLSINDKVLPEIDFSYFVTPQFAVELILTYPQKQKIRANGVEIGTLKHLPPTLTAQYHFTDFGAFKPYVGAGVNYTRFSNVKFIPGVDASVEKNSWGFAVQAGMDYEVSKNLYVNFDVKKVQIRTDISSGGAKLGEFRVDPWLIGLGIGRRF